MLGNNLFSFTLIHIQLQKSTGLCSRKNERIYI